MIKQPLLFLSLTLRARVHNYSRQISNIQRGGGLISKGYPHSQLWIGAASSRRWRLACYISTG
jgi:hypothetical protein